jgi:predicted DNA-binding transcriptional regulator YafY
MDKLDRIFGIHRILSARRYPVSAQTLASELRCSKVTISRLIQFLRDHLGAPIETRRGRGYVYDASQPAVYELPGLWFSADELYALLTSYRLLGSLQEGILDEYIAPLRDRLAALLKDERAGHAEIQRRVRILPSGSRETRLDHFRSIASALIERRRLRILYHGRARDAATERIVSPQRLAYYRDNWYLDAWCHLRKGLRSFSLDRLHPLESLTVAALDVPDAELDAHFAAAYGIFAGPAEHIAHLRFSSTAAKWVADERWHAQQSGEVLADGRYELRVPYADPTELIMEILKYGPEVEVLGPDTLRNLVAVRLRRAADLYGPA